LDGQGSLLNDLTGGFKGEEQKNVRLISSTPKTLFTILRIFSEI